MGTINVKGNSIRNIKADVKKVGQEAAVSPLIEAFTRLGYGVRGLIYMMMGLLALNVAFLNGGAPADQKGAIAAIGRQPGGLVLLWVVLIGLVSYSLWGVIRAVLDPLRKGHDLKGVLTRIGFMFSAVSYAILVLPTYGFISGSGNTAQNGAQAQQSLASIMSRSWGPYAIGFAGLLVIAVGIYQIYQGIDSKFDRQFKTYAMTAKEVKAANQLGRFGTATRGLILAVVGGLLVVAAYQSNSSQKIGLDTALSTLKQQPLGNWLLGIVAVGLIAFGLYSMLSAAWFRLKR